MPDKEEIESGIRFSGRLDPSLTEAVKRAGEHIEELHAKILELPRGFSELGEKILELSGATFLFEKLEDAIRDLGSEWGHLIDIGEAHVAMQSRLQVSLESQPHLIREGTRAVNEQIEAIERLAKSQERSTTFSEKFTEGLASRLTSIGIKSETGVEPLIKGYQNELARRGKYSGTDEDAQAIEEALAQAFQGKARGLARMFPTLGITGDVLKGQTPDQIIATLIAAIERMPNYSLRNTPGGQIANFKNIQERIEDTKGEIATNLTAPFDDFLAHLESRFADGPLKWFEDRVTEWGQSIDKWVNQVAIPAWDTFTDRLAKTVGPQLEETSKDMMDLAKTIGDETGLSGELNKIKEGDFSDVVYGIDSAVKALNEELKNEKPIWGELLQDAKEFGGEIRSIWENIVKVREWMIKPASEQRADIWKWLWDNDDNRKAIEESKSPLIQGTRRGLETLHWPGQLTSKQRDALNDTSGQTGLTGPDAGTGASENVTQSVLDMVTKATMQGEGAHGAATGYETSHPGADEFYGFNSWQDPEEYNALKKLYSEGKINSPEAAHIIAKSLMRRAGDLAGQYTNKAAQFEILDVAPMRGTDVVKNLLSQVGSVDEVNQMSSKQFAEKFSTVWEAYERQRFGKRSDLIGGLVDRVHRDSGIASTLGDVEQKTSEGQVNDKVSAHVRLLMEKLGYDAVQAGKKASTGETDVETTERVLKQKANETEKPASNQESRKLRSTSEHPITIQNVIHVHAAQGQSEHAIAEAVDKHLKAKARDHAVAVVQHIKDMRETHPA
jgi:hypothetical protein